jgi:thiol-disulfide isomerase/thioredoxin
MNPESTSQTKRRQSSMRWWPLILLLLLFVWCGLHHRDGVSSSATTAQQQPIPSAAGLAPSTPIAAVPPTHAIAVPSEAMPPSTVIIPSPRMNAIAKPSAPIASRPSPSPRRALPLKTPERGVAAPVVPPIEGEIAVPRSVPVLDEPVSFEATTIDGAAFSLQKLRGKVVLIDFISVHCGYCFEELDTLQDLKRRYPEVVVVAVAAGETAEEVRTSLDARDLPFPFPVIADPQSRVLEGLPSYGTPTHVVLDREGRFSSERVVIGVNQPAVLERVVRVASGLPARRVVTAREAARNSPTPAGVH